MFVTELDFPGRRRSRSQADRSRRVGQEDGAFGGGADESAIAREDAAGVAERRRLPVGETLGDLGLVEVDRERSASMSIVIVSPSRTAASGPPRAASGAT